MISSSDKLHAIVARCAALGLSLSQANRFAEADATGDVVHVLGLDPTTLMPLEPKRWLWMAAQTSGVSYRQVLTEETLLACLMSGEAPDEVIAPIVHFLEEAPMQLVVMAIEEAAQRTGVPISSLWDNLHRLATTRGSRRIKLR